MEVSIDTFIGELSFFTGKPRSASARSTNFTEVLTLYLSEFLEVAERHPKQLDTFNAIRRELSKAENLNLLGTECYICKGRGHIATDCPRFSEIKGNLT